MWAFELSWAQIEISLALKRRAIKARLKWLS
jgi:hypothetical protein